MFYESVKGNYFLGLTKVLWTLNEISVWNSKMSWDLWLPRTIRIRWESYHKVLFQKIMIFLSRIFSDIKIEYIYIYIYIDNVLHLSHNDLKEIGKFTQHLLPAQNLQKKAKKASLSYFETTTLFKQDADGSETLTRFLRVKKTVQSRTRLRSDSTHLTER